MKRSSLLIIAVLLGLSACLPQTLTLVPVDTLVAQTMAALPKTDTPLPPTNTVIPSATPDNSTPTPEINLAAPGAYCIPPNTQRTRVLVARVLDAETIEVATGLNSFRVRYIGLDAPVLSPTLEWQAPQAIAANERMVSGKYVVLIKDVSDVDVNGFFLRYVMVDNTFVNYEMIRLGFARVAIMPPDVACENAFLAAQIEAQSNSLGVWQATPVPTFTITLTPSITNTPKPATATKPPPCNCFGPRLTCNDFPSQRKAQACFEYCRSLGLGDIFGLDKNGNGIACEGS